MNFVRPHVDAATSYRPQGALAEFKLIFIFVESIANSSRGRQRRRQWLLLTGQVRLISGYLIGPSRSRAACEKWHILRPRHSL